MTYIFKYAWLAILIISYVIWTVYVITEFKYCGFDCFEDSVCAMWLVTHIVGIFIMSLTYCISS